MISQRDKKTKRQNEIRQEDKRAKKINIAKGTTDPRVEFILQNID